MNTNSSNTSQRPGVKIHIDDLLALVEFPLYSVVWTFLLAYHQPVVHHRAQCKVSARLIFVIYVWHD